MASRDLPPDLRGAFEDLRPPPGGLVQLRGRLDARRRPVWPWVLVATAALALVLLRPSTTAPLVVEDVGLVALGLAGPSGEPVWVPASAAERVAVARVETGDPKVVLYQVASLQ